MIAYTAFRNYVLTLDFRDKTISVSSPRTMESHGSVGKLSHPTFGQHGPPIVATTGFAVNGRPITVQVDTIFSGSLLIYPTSVDKLGLTTKARSDKQRFFPFTDGGVNLREASAASETFDGRRLTRNTTIYFATPGVHLPDGLFDGTVGVELMKNHVVTFDFQANTFSIS